MVLTLIPDKIEKCIRSCIHDDIDFNIYKEKAEKAANIKAAFRTIQNDLDRYSDEIAFSDSQISILKKKLENTTGFFKKAERAGIEAQIREAEGRKTSAERMISSVLSSKGFTSEDDYLEKRWRADVFIKSCADNPIFEKISTGARTWRDTFAEVKDAISSLADEDFLHLAPELISIFDKEKELIITLDLPLETKEDLFIRVSSMQKELGVEERERRIRGGKV